MGETPNQIEGHIRETRNDLSEQLNELQEKVKSTVDWRVQFQERPMVMIALAFGGGILLSALLPSRHTSRKNARAHVDAVPDREPRTFAESPSARDNKPNQTADTLNALKGALVGAAVTQVSGFIEEALPGFKQEWSKTQVGKNLNRSDMAASDQQSWQKTSAVGAG